MTSIPARKRRNSHGPHRIGDDANHGGSPKPTPVAGAFQQHHRRQLGATRAHPRTRHREIGAVRLATSLPPSTAPFAQHRGAQAAVALRSAVRTRAGVVDKINPLCRPGRKLGRRLDTSCSSTARSSRGRDDCGSDRAGRAPGDSISSCGASARRSFRSLPFRVRWSCCALSTSSDSRSTRSRSSPSCWPAVSSSTTPS